MFVYVVAGIFLSLLLLLLELLFCYSCWLLFFATSLSRIFWFSSSGKMRKRNTTTRIHTATNNNNNIYLCAIRPKEFHFISISVVFFCTRVCAVYHRRHHLAIHTAKKTRTQNFKREIGYDKFFFHEERTSDHSKE